MTLLHILAAIIAIAAFVLTVSAQQLSDPTSLSLKEVLGLIIVGAAVLAILGNVAWSFFNRRGYDKLKLIIAEQKELIESHEKRHENHKLASREMETRLTCKITSCETEVQRLSVNNQAVVSQNLQMKAILRQLRLAGQWQGHEDTLFEYKDQ